MSSRQRTSSGELPGRIVEAALELLSDEGVESLTVRGIAERANVAPMGLYNHFDGKNGVVDAIWTEGFDRLRAALEEAFNEPDPLEALVTAGNNYRRFALANVAHYQIMFVVRVKEFTPSIEAARTAALAHNTLVQLIERAQRGGTVRPQNPYDLAQQIWASCHGYVSLEILHMNFANDADEAFVSLLRALARGLALDGEHVVKDVRLQQRSKP